MVLKNSGWRVWIEFVWLMLGIGSELLQTVMNLQVL
jgi:hypothetical protein